MQDVYIPLVGIFVVLELIPCGSRDSWVEGNSVGQGERSERKVNGSDKERL